MKIKISIGPTCIVAAPIYPKIAQFSGKIPTPRGRNGLPKSAAPRIRRAVEEIGGNFATIILDTEPSPALINRLRTHLDTKCVGVIEHGIKNGWHIHLVADIPKESLRKICENYGRTHISKILDKKRTGWYLTKSIGDSLPENSINHWYFCSRDAGRLEVFYVNCSIVHLLGLVDWQIMDWCFLAHRTNTSVARLKNLPRWIDPAPPPDYSTIPN